MTNQRKPTEGRQRSYTLKLTMIVDFNNILTGRFTPRTKIVKKR